MVVGNGHHNIPADNDWEQASYSKIVTDWAGCLRQQVQLLHLLQGCQLFLILQKTSSFSGKINQS